MIKINKDYSIEQQTHQCVVSLHGAGKNKQGDTIDTVKCTYHGTLLQACQFIVNNSSIGCSTAKEVIEAIKESTSVIIKAIDNEQPR